MKTINLFFNIDNFNKIMNNIARFNINIPTKFNISEKHLQIQYFYPEGEYFEDFLKFFKFIEEIIISILRKLSQSKIEEKEKYDIIVLFYSKLIIMYDNWYLICLDEKFVPSYYLYPNLDNQQFQIVPFF